MSCFNSLISDLQLVVWRFWLVTWDLWLFPFHSSLLVPRTLFLDPVFFPVVCGLWAVVIWLFYFLLWPWLHALIDILTSWNNILIYLGVNVIKRFSLDGDWPDLLSASLKRFPQNLEHSGRKLEESGNSSALFWRVNPRWIDKNIIKLWC